VAHPLSGTRHAKSALDFVHRATLKRKARSVSDKRREGGSSAKKAIKANRARKEKWTRYVLGTPGLRSPGGTSGWGHRTGALPQAQPPRAPGVPSTVPWFSRTNAGATRTSRQAFESRAGRWFANFASLAGSAAGAEEREPRSAPKESRRAQATDVDSRGLVTMVRDLPHAPVAQLDRALVYGTKGRKFESSRARYPPRRSFEVLGPSRCSVLRGARSFEVLDS
jgi:hypothetical protein